jgi:hypothetical protein
MFFKKKARYGDVHLKSQHLGGGSRRIEDSGQLHRRLRATQYIQSQSRLT